MVNILHVNSSFGYGGTEKNMTTIARNMDEDFSSFFCCTGDPGPRYEILEEEGFDILDSGEKQEVLKFLEEEEIDIVHIHGASSIVEEFIEELSEMVEAVVKTDNFGWPNQDEKAVRENIDAYIFPSRFCSYRFRTLCDGVLPEEKIYTVYNAVDEVNSGIEYDLREDLDISEDSVVIGKIGRPDPNKWSSDLVDALESVEDSGVVLLLLNPPEKIQESLEDKNLDIDVKGASDIPVGEIGSFYNTIDILAHTSFIGETFGYVIAEAMSYGVPPVVESTPMRDNAQIELVDNGENGLVVASEEGLSNAVSRLISDQVLREELGDEAVEKVRDSLDVEKTVENIESIYRDVLEDERSLGEDVEFSDEYKSRLVDIFAKEDVYHRLERYSWYLSSFVGSYLLYQKSRGVFRRIRKFTN
jgi:glycosyltransferase involved in cell wall biosynthesis